MLYPLNYIYEHNILIHTRIQDPLGVMQTYRLTATDLIGLCGGIPLPAPKQMDLHIFSAYQGTLHVHLVTDQYELTRTFDCDTGIIKNQGMIVHLQGQGTGTSLLVNQIQAAKEKAFKKLYIVAQAPTGTAPYWTGFYCWGRLGYTMRNDDNIRFRDWAKQNNRSEETLFELLRTPTGRKLWKAEGFEWLGEFLLHDDSTNMRYLKLYLDEKQSSHI